MRVEDALFEALAPAGEERGRLAAALREEADAIGFDRRFLDRALNVDLSGGERKRNEILQMAVVRPRFAVLDEIDSGLDVDALRAVARRVERATVGMGARGAGRHPLPAALGGAGRRPGPRHGRWPDRRRRRAGAGRRARRVGLWRLRPPRDPAPPGRRPLKLC